MELRHKCLKCNHPCEVSLALTSVNCSNEVCEFYGVPKPPEDKSDSTPAKEPPKGWKEHIRESVAKNMAELPCPVAGCAGRIAITDEHGDRQNTMCMRCHTYFRIKDGIHDEKIIEVVGSKLNTDGVKTGRLSSKRPSFANMPKTSFERHAEARFDEVYGKPDLVDKTFKELTSEMLPALAEPFTSFEERYLRWPKTMRVVDRSALEVSTKTHHVNKEGQPLLGVLCLIDTDAHGLSSKYNYIGFGEHKHSVRATIVVTRHTQSKKHRFPPGETWKRYEDKIGTRENFNARILQLESERLHIQEVHLTAIKLEFELDLVRKRRPRSPTVAEQAWFNLLKSNLKNGK